MGKLAECDWCYSLNLDSALISETERNHFHICKECGCEFTTHRKNGVVKYNLLKSGERSMRLKYKQAFNNEYWTDYTAFTKQNIKGKLRGGRYAIMGASAGSLLGPAGGLVGGIAGYIYGVFQVEVERVENNGKCATNEDIMKEALKYGIAFKKKL